MGFDQSLLDGTIGEYIVWNFFNDSTGVKEVIDVRCDKVFQMWDVDFLILDSKRQVSWIEVKTDFKAHETGNFVYEVASNRNFNTIGCLEKTKAQIIACFVPVSANLYLISVAKLKKFVQSNNLNLVNMGDNAKGFLLPIAELERNGVIQGMFDVSKYYRGEKT
jgi:hypothetical protein